MEESWHPLLGVLGALLLGVAPWAWSQSGAEWGPAVVYASLAAAGALWLKEQGAPRTFAAYIVTAALVLAFLLPFAWLAVPPPER